MARRPADLIKRALRFCPAVVAVSVIVYLALRSTSELQAIEIVPGVVTRFLDRNDFLSNMLGYTVLTVIAHMTWSGRSRLGLAEFCGRGAALVVLVAGLECAQLFLPHRNFDPNDIVAGVAGVVLASAPWFFASPKPAGAQEACERR